MKRLLKLILFCSIAGMANTTHAQDIHNLLIEGNDTLPGIVGDYAPDETFSWVQNFFPLNGTGHSWTLGPGTHGGVLLNREQTPGELTSFRPVFNVPTAFYSVNNGISISTTNVIDMSNLRMIRDGEVTDLGAGSGYNVLVPPVSDITTLAFKENGWILNPDNTYHIIYNTVGTCPDCRLILHFYGEHIQANGDINDDGNVDIADILLSQQEHSGQITFNLQQQLRADVAPLINGKAAPDSNVNLSDVIVIQKKAMGLINF